MTLTVDQLTELLKKAKDAHVHFESVTGRTDDDWPRWYAEHIIGALAADDSRGKTPRFMIVSDNSGHRYVIPVKKRDEWWAFVEIPEDDPRSWNVPEWAERIDGGRVTFTDWRIE